MTWWILLFCLVVSVWGLVDTVDRDPGAARLWMVVLLVICGLAFALYAEQEGLWSLEREVYESEQNGVVGTGQWHEDVTRGKTLEVG